AATHNGGYASNKAADGKGPAKMQDPSKKPAAGSTFILADEAVALDASKFKAGDKVPRELLARWTGSRGDIEAKGVYASGKWTVIFHRKLDTGHSDDVQFVAGKTYPFGLSVFDNTGGVNHTISEDVLTLKFK
ncbi:MAG: ethylbenzene dehydrogenase-related protein, partial [Chloroflexota bacterium]